MPCSWFYRRVLVALLLAAACLWVGGPLDGAAAATPSVHPPAGTAGPTGARVSASKRTSTGTVGVRRYTVRPGDSLIAIATRHRYPGGWPRLYAHNRRTVGQDPNLIFPGQILRLVSPRPSPRLSPIPRRPAISPKAPAGGDAAPVEAAASSKASIAPEPAQPPAAKKTIASEPAKAPAATPDTVPEPAQPTAATPRVDPQPVRPILVILLGLGLVLAALTIHRLQARRRVRPAARTRPITDPTPASRPTPTTPGPPPRPGPTPANGHDPVSFSLVLMADGEGGADLEPVLSQLAALDHQRLGIVVVVGDDDPAAWSAAEAVRRRIPERITILTDRQRPGTVASAIDRALPACQGEVTGVLDAGTIHPELLDRVAGHVRQDGATMVWAGTRSHACRWSSSRAPGRFKLRLVPGRGQLVFVRTELLRTPTAQNPEHATGAGARPRTTTSMPGGQARLWLPGGGQDEDAGAQGPVTVGRPDLLSPQASSPGLQIRRRGPLEVPPGRR
jgi:glycosyl transferase family 2/LysM domain-containing protein